MSFSGNASKKKKILFVMNNLHTGGAEKALVSLLQEFDFDRYEVDLFLFQHAGMFLKQVPQEVRILPEPVDYRFFDQPVSASIKNLLLTFRPLLAWRRLKFGLIMRSKRSSSMKEQRAWKLLSATLPKLSGYDVAIGYLQRSPIYFCVDNVSAAKKLGFIHNDYKQLAMDASADKRYLQQLDTIFSVSESCVDILKEEFPDLTAKIKLMYNVISPNNLFRLAEEPLSLHKKALTLVSVGRLHPQKGFDMAVEACKVLVDKGCDVVWYILGEGAERAALEQRIADYHLEQHFVLCGIKENPYPYIKAADIYVQPSRFEGKSIAIDEAKVLGKPIIVTDFPSVRDQIQHLQTGYIVPFEAAKLADAIMHVAGDKQVQDKFRVNLHTECSGIKNQLQVLDDAIDK